MPTHKSMRLLLHNELKHEVTAGSVLYTAIDCKDASDIALKSSKVKELPRNTSVLVEGIYRTADGTFQAIKATHNNIHYYLHPYDLTIFPLW